MRRPAGRRIVEERPLFGGAQFHILIDFAAELLPVDRMCRRRVRHQRRHRRRRRRVPPPSCSDRGRSGAWARPLAKLCLGGVETNFTSHHTDWSNDVRKESRLLGKFRPARERRGINGRPGDPNDHQNRTTKSHWIIGGFARSADQQIYSIARREAPG